MMTTAGWKKVTAVMLASGTLAFNTACGTQSVSSSAARSHDADARTRDGKDDPGSRQEPRFDSEALLLAETLEAELLAQGHDPAQVRAIVDAALEGSRQDAASLGLSATQGANLIDVKSFLPGFLKGALGVAVTVITGGSPIAIAGSIVEAVVRGVSQGAKSPSREGPLPTVPNGSGGSGGSDVLANLPALALEILLKVRAPGATPDRTQDILLAVLAAARGVVALPKADVPDSASIGLSKEMMERLVSVLMGTPGLSKDEIAYLLPRLLETLQGRLVASVPAHAQNLLALLLGAVSEGQISGLGKGLSKVGGLDGDAKNAYLKSIVSTLLQKGSDHLLGKIGKAARKQALQASLLGASRAALNAKVVSRDELADVFASVAQALRQGEMQKPDADAEVAALISETFDLEALLAQAR